VRGAAAGLSTGSRKKKDSTWAHNFPLNIRVRTEGELQQLLPIIDSAERSIVARGEPDIAFPDTLAQELRPSDSFPEGAKKSITINAYERSPDARAACIAHYGLVCTACGFDFEETYGDLGRGFIHVHHIVPIASVAADYEVNPIKDLRPVCPNCHEMLHRRQPPLSIDELKVLISNNALELQ